MTTDARPRLQRTFQVELQEIEGRMVEGCLVPYGEATKVRDDPSGPTYFERFEPGAFRKQLGAPNRIELDYEHGDDLASSIGVGRSLSDDASGMFGSFKIHAGAFGDQALELVREGILRGFSVLFVDRYAHPRVEQGVVVRSSCQLLRVALCRAPAYRGALVTAMRSRQEWEKDYDLPPSVDDEQLARLRALGVQV